MATFNRHINENLTSIHNTMGLGDTLMAILFDLSASYWGALRRGDYAEKGYDEKLLRKIMERVGARIEVLTMAPGQFDAIHLDRICERLRVRVEIIQNAIAGLYDQPNPLPVIEKSEEDNVIFQAPLSINRDTPLHFSIDSRQNRTVLEKGDSTLPVFPEDLVSLKKIIACMEMHGETV